MTQPDTQILAETKSRNFDRRTLLTRGAQGAAAALAVTQMPGIRLSSGAAWAAGDTTLKFSDHQPLAGMRSRFLKEVVFPAIEAEANGQLRIEDHWNGEIAAAYDALNAVTTGATDLGTVVPEYTAKQLPLHQIFKSFIRGPVGGQQIDFFKRVYAEIPAFRQELDANNMVPLFFGTGYPVAFFSTRPMQGLEDLKGGTWRSASFWHLDFLANAGATPVRMHWGPEIPEALKAGTLDGLMVNIDSGYNLKVHESAPHILVSKELWLGHVYILAVNKDSWAALSEGQRTTIERAIEKSYATLDAVMAQSFDRQVAELEAAGATVRVLEAREVAAFAAATDYRKVQSAWARDRRADGVNNAEGVLEQVRAIMDDFAV